MGKPAMFSRSGTSHPLGKCDDRLDIPMPTELKEQLHAVATLDGKPSGEWARDELEKLVAGRLVFMRRRMRGQAASGDGIKEG
jgi:hypothetical protein